MFQDSPKMGIPFPEKTIWGNCDKIIHHFSMLSDILFCQFGFFRLVMMSHYMMIWAGLPKKDILNRQAIIDPESGNDSIIYPVLSKKNQCHNLDCRKSCSTCAWMKTPWKRGLAERWRRCSRLPGTLRVRQAPALKAGSKACIPKHDFSWPGDKKKKKKASKNKKEKKLKKKGKSKAGDKVSETDSESEVSESLRRVRERRLTQRPRKRTRGQRRGMIITCCTSQSKLAGQKGSKG